MITHCRDHRLANTRKKRLRETQFAAKTCRTANDHAQDITPSNVTGKHTVADEESRSTAVIGQNAICYEIRLNIGIGVPSELLNALENRNEHIRIIVRGGTLHHHHEPLETRASVHVLRRQGFQYPPTKRIVLDEHQVPQLHKPVTVTIYLALMTRYTLHITEPAAAIVVDLAIRPARTSIRHFPKVVFPAEVENMGRIDPGLALPIAHGLRIRRYLSLIILEHGSVQTIAGKPPRVDQQLPRPRNRFLFVVIAKRPVP